MAAGPGPVRLFKPPKRTTFNVLKTLPDQIEVTIPQLRSFDNADVSMDLMIFAQLVDVEKLLNATCFLQ